jgi:hypothetical protein
MARCTSIIEIQAAIVIKHPDVSDLGFSLWVNDSHWGDMICRPSVFPAVQGWPCKKAGTGYTVRIETAKLCNLQFQTEIAVTTLLSSLGAWQSYWLNIN